jgi:Na+/H+ antiporter NhaD/arsenite permease-like protein
MLQVGVVTAIFVVTYFFIVTERVNRTTIALAGALAVLLVPGLSFTQHEAIDFVDFNTLGLLIGMMVIVAALKRTGVFRSVALVVAKAGRGRIFVVYAGFAVITAVASAFIDNVTTVLMIVPVIYLISSFLGKSAIPFLIMEILMSNIGGMATLIGDPPNILVGSRAVLPPDGGSLSFLDFLTNLGPIAAICFGAALLFLRYRERGDFLTRPQEEKLKALDAMDAKQAIKDTGLLRKCLLALGVVLVGFLLHHQLHLEPATVALAGAALLLIITRIDPAELLAEVEWTVLFFFIGLFVLVGALEKVGVVEYLARQFMAVSENPTILVVLLLWLTAVVSAFLSAVPTVTVLIPLVQVVVNHMAANGAPDVAPAFWWALAAGACLGGNATVVGAAANIAVVGLSQKEREPLNFKAFSSVGVPVTILSLVLTSAYIVLRYL